MTPGFPGPGQNADSAATASVSLAGKASVAQTPRGSPGSLAPESHGKLKVAPRKSVKKSPI